MSTQEVKTSIQETEDMREFSKHSSDVRLEDVTKIFVQPDTHKDFVAVNHISLEIKSGEMVTLLGPSGCGKTTTLRMISGFEYPTSGRIFIGGKPMENVPPNKRNLAMVFQSYALFPHMNIWDNVAYGLKIKRLSKSEIESRTRRVMEMMQLTGFEKRKPNQLSGGQQQRVALARAVVIEPGVLLFDEPLSNLDAKLRETMRDELRQLQLALGITSLYVTHDQSEAMAISDRIIIMKDGDLVQMGTPREIYDFPVNTFIANFIGKANKLPVVYEGEADGGAKVTFHGHPIFLPNPGRAAFGGTRSIQPGDSGLLSVRPESMMLTRTGDGLPAVVVRKVYFGSEIQYDIRLKGEEQTVTIYVYNPQAAENFEVGDQLKLSLDRQCIRLLAE